MNERGQYKEALAILQKALDIDDKFATAHGNLAGHWLGADRRTSRRPLPDGHKDHRRLPAGHRNHAHHANLANLLNNLGAALANRGQLTRQSPIPNGAEK